MIRRPHDDDVAAVVEAVSQAATALVAAKASEEGLGSL